MTEWMQHTGKVLMLTGVFIVVIGIALYLSGRLPWPGRLPGDFVIKGKNFFFYFPLATSILVSIFLTLLYWLFGRR